MEKPRERVYGLYERQDGTIGTRPSQCSDDVHIKTVALFVFQKLQAENEQLKEKLQITLKGLKTLRDDKSPPWDNIDHRALARQTLEKMEAVK